jgi:glycosyltransferase involved in cell wall biosynthesis
MNLIVIINFLPISSGGGLQNALSFVNELPRNSLSECIFIVRRNSLIEDALNRKKFKTLSVKEGLLNRLQFELFARQHFKRDDVCFTFFGPPILSLIGYTHNINGFAYSNLLYPNLDFWWFQPTHKKVKSKVIDLYRKYSMSFADELIYETDILKKRALQDPLLKGINSHVVKMAASSLVSPSKIDDSDPEFEIVKNLDGFKLLFLSGSQPNKRIKEFVQTLHVLNQISEKKAYMILTMNKEDSYYQSIQKSAEQFGVLKYIVNMKTVLPRKVSTLISHCDALVNVALLESFSNNYIEAWKMSKLLFVTNADWAKHNCGKAAQYIDVNSPGSSANLILYSMQNKSPILAEIKAHLETFPTSSDKNAQYLEIIKKAQI